MIPAPSPVRVTPGIGQTHLTEPERIQGDKIFADALGHFFDAGDHLGSRAEATDLMKASDSLSQGLPVLERALPAGGQLIGQVKEASVAAHDLAGSILGIAGPAWSPAEQKGAIDGWINTTIQAGSVFSPGRSLIQ